MKTLTWHVWYIYSLMSVLYTKKNNGKVRVAQVVQVERDDGGHGRYWSDWRKNKKESSWGALKPGAEEVKTDKLDRM